MSFILPSLWVGNLFRFDAGKGQQVEGPPRAAKCLATLLERHECLQYLTSYMMIITELIPLFSAVFCITYFYFVHTALSYRRCEENGTWEVISTGKTWTNTSACVNNVTLLVSVAINDNVISLFVDNYSLWACPGCINIDS